MVRTVPIHFPFDHLAVLTCWGGASFSPGEISAELQEMRRIFCIPTFLALLLPDGTGPRKALKRGRGWGMPDSNVNSNGVRLMRNPLGSQNQNPTESQKKQLASCGFGPSDGLTLCDAENGFETNPLDLDCFWVGSLDFNFLGNQGVFH